MDDTIRKAIFHLTTEGEVKWNDPQRLGIKDPDGFWYYAEKEQYIIRDVMTDMYFFVKARSPKEAFKKFRDRLDEAMKAG